MQYLYRAFRVEVYRNQADLMSAIKCHVPLVGTPGTQTGTPGTQEPNERGKDESLKKLLAILRQNPKMKRKELASELGVGLRTFSRIDFCRYCLFIREYEKISVNEFSSKT